MLFEGKTPRRPHLEHLKICICYPLLRNGSIASQFGIQLNLPTRHIPLLQTAVVVTFLHFSYLAASLRGSPCLKIVIFHSHDENTMSKLCVRFVINHYYFAPISDYVIFVQPLFVLRTKKRSKVFFNELPRLILRMLLNFFVFIVSCKQSHSNPSTT